MAHVKCDNHTDIITFLKKNPQLVDEVLSNNIDVLDWEDFNNRCFFYEDLKIKWNIDLIHKYENFLCFIIRPSWDAYQIIEIGEEEYKHSFRNNNFGLKWTLELIDAFIDKWDWYLFSILFPIELTEYILCRYSRYWDKELIKQNHKIEENECFSIKVYNNLQNFVTTGANEFYKEKLKDVRWLEKCEEIKIRDNFCCVRCNEQQDKIIELDKIDDLKLFLNNVELDNFEQIKYWFEKKRNEVILRKEKLIF